MALLNGQLVAVPASLAAVTIDRQAHADSGCDWTAEDVKVITDYQRTQQLPGFVSVSCCVCV
jgi:hypothetical protein